jgi:hypothetical protein
MAQPHCGPTGTRQHPTAVAEEDSEKGGGRLSKNGPKSGLLQRESTPPAPAEDDRNDPHPTPPPPAPAAGRGDPATLGRRPGPPPAPPHPPARPTHPTPRQRLAVHPPPTGRVRRRLAVDRCPLRRGHLHPTRPPRAPAHPTHPHPASPPAARRRCPAGRGPRRPSADRGVSGRPRPPDHGPGRRPTTSRPPPARRRARPTGRTRTRPGARPRTASRSRGPAPPRPRPRPGTGTGVSGRLPSSVQGAGPDRHRPGPTW